MQISAEDTVPDGVTGPENLELVFLPTHVYEAKQPNTISSYMVDLMSVQFTKTPMLSCRL